MAEMQQEYMQEIARRDAKHSEEMAKMWEQLQQALGYLSKKQDLSASATQDTVSMAASSSSDVAASGFVVINRRSHQSQLTRIEDHNAFVDATESVCSRDFMQVTGDEE